VEQLQNFARIKRARVSFISGDVHCASAGYFQTLKVKGKPDVLPINDYRYMINIVSSEHRMSMSQPVKLIIVLGAIVNKSAFVFFK
jgi:hypothetical protein